MPATKAGRSARRKQWCRSVRRASGPTTALAASPPKVPVSLSTTPREACAVEKAPAASSRGRRSPSLRRRIICAIDLAALSVQVIPAARARRHRLVKPSRGLTGAAYLGIVRPPGAVKLPRGEREKNIWGAEACLMPRAHLKSCGGSRKKGMRAAPAPARHRPTFFSAFPRGFSPEAGRATAW